MEREGVQLLVGAVVLGLALLLSFFSFSELGILDREKIFEKNDFSEAEEDFVQSAPPVTTNNIRYIDECKKPLFMAMSKQTINVPPQDPQELTIHHYSKYHSGRIGELKSFSLGKSYYEDLIGDINNDGYSDIVLTKIQNSFEFYVYSGKNGNLIYHKTGLANQIYNIRGIKDISGDGYPDIGVYFSYVGGPPYGYGGVEYYSGVDGSYLGLIQGEKQYDQFGYTFDTIGDINGDGNNDLIISANC